MERRVARHSPWGHRWAEFRLIPVALDSILSCFGLHVGLILPPFQRFGLSFPSFLRDTYLIALGFSYAAMDMASQRNRRWDQSQRARRARRLLAATQSAVCSLGAPQARSFKSNVSPLARRSRKRRKTSAKTESQSVNKFISNVINFSAGCAGCACRH